MRKQGLFTFIILLVMLSPFAPRSWSKEAPSGKEKKSTTRYRAKIVRKTLAPEGDPLTEPILRFPEDKNIWKIVLMLQEKYPEAKILLLEVFPRGKTANDSVRKKINMINAFLRKECAGMKNVQMRDLSSCFIDQDGNIPTDIMPDFLHPEEIGYERWAKAIEPDIEKVLGPIPADPPECNWFSSRSGTFQAKE